MIDHFFQPADSWLARVFGNAGLLVLTSLLVTSIGLGRYGVALVWLGALLVLFVHLLELGRWPARTAAFSRRVDTARVIGAACALAGVTVTLV